jgi:hypothetical protein
MDEDALLTMVFIVIIIGLATGLGVTIVSGFSYFRRFKKINCKWFIGGMIAGIICTIIGIASWVCFVIEYGSITHVRNAKSGLSNAPGYLSVVGTGVDIYAGFLAAGVVEMMHELTLRVTFIMGTYCMILGIFGIVSCTRLSGVRKDSKTIPGVVFADILMKVRKVIQKEE